MKDKIIKWAENYESLLESYGEVCTKLISYQFVVERICNTEDADLRWKLTNEFNVDINKVIEKMCEVEYKISISK